VTAAVRPDKMDASGQADPYRFGKAYTVTQAATLAGVAPTTVRRWLAGDEEAQTDARVSFLQVIEIAVVAQFRRAQRPVQLERLRRAHTFARERLGLPYPFASQSFRDLGERVLHEFDRLNPGGPAVALDVGGQWAIPGSVTNVLKRVDFSGVDHLAERWFPAGRDVPIVLDPRIGAGRLTVRGSGVTIDTIFGRFRAGETIEQLASDYELDHSAIQEAIRYADRSDLAVA
jgi:uncharacterized protein (DUF433 family)